MSFVLSLYVQCMPATISPVMASHKKQHQNTVHTHVHINKQKKVPIKSLAYRFTNSHRLPPDTICSATDLGQYLRSAQKLYHCNSRQVYIRTHTPTHSHDQEKSMTCHRL